MDPHTTAFFESFKQAFGQELKSVEPQPDDNDVHSQTQKVTEKRRKQFRQPTPGVIHCIACEDAQVTSEDIMDNPEFRKRYCKECHIYLCPAHESYGDFNPQQCVACENYICHNSYDCSGFVDACSQHRTEGYAQQILSQVPPLWINVPAADGDGEE